MITTIVIVLVIYFAAMVVIGYMGRDKAEDFEGYLSMGRSGGVLLLMGGAVGGQIGNGFVVGGAAEGASVGMVTDQPTYQRVNSAKSAKISRIACYLSFLLMIPLALMPAFIGSYGAYAYGAEGSHAFFDVILQELPPIVCALIISAVLAAVMSTIDCGLITMSTVLTRDIWQGALKKNPSEEQLKKITLGVNIGFMLTSTILAISASSILGLLNSVYSFLAASCFVPFAKHGFLPKMVIK